MEHYPEDFETETNPFGVGPFFGVTVTNNLGEKMLQIRWCDGKTLKIDQVYTWLCPNVNENKPLKGKFKHPETGAPIIVFVQGYTQFGVKLSVQEVVGKSAKSSKNNAGKRKKSPPLQYHASYMYPPPYLCLKNNGERKKSPPL